MTLDRDIARLVMELEDRRQIGALLPRYARGIDRRDWGLVRSCFTEDAFVDGSVAAFPIDEYIEHQKRVIVTWCDTMHFMGNQIIDLEGDVAQMETYGILLHWTVPPAGVEHEANMILGARYRDHVVRCEDGEWRIKNRDVSPDWRIGPYAPEEQRVRQRLAEST